MFMLNPCNLHMYALVDFDDTYTGQSFFPNDATHKTWVLIKPTAIVLYSHDLNVYVEHTLTQIMQFSSAR